MSNSDKTSSIAESVQSSSRAMRTGWWVLFALGLLAIGVVGAVLSIKIRGTRTDQTEAFFGSDAVAALESSSVLRLRVHEDPVPQASSGRIVDLAEIPGVGHLRHALLDQRHYDWTTQQAEDIDRLANIAQPQWASIELEGTPPGHTEMPGQAEIQPTVLRLELSEGWVGIPGKDRRVRLYPRVARAVREKVLTMINVRATRSDRPGR